MSAAFKPLMQAESIIQRDAVMSALNDAGIEALAEKRDISRKIADSTVDLAYEGYSALFDGFTIQVREADFQRAKKIADALVTKARNATPDKGLSQGGALRRFYFCSLFTMVMPGIFHGLAIFHLVDGLRKGEKLHPVFAAFSIALGLGTGCVTFYLLYNADLMSTLRSWADLLK